MARYMELSSCLELFTNENAIVTDKTEPKLITTDCTEPNYRWESNRTRTDLETIF